MGTAPMASCCCVQVEHSHLVPTSSWGWALPPWPAAACVPVEHSHLVPTSSWRWALLPWPAAACVQMEHSHYLCQVATCGLEQFFWPQFEYCKPHFLAASVEGLCSARALD